MNSDSNAGRSSRNPACCSACHTSCLLRLPAVRQTQAEGRGLLDWYVSEGIHTARGGGLLTWLTRGAFACWCCTLKPPVAVPSMCEAPWSDREATSCRPAAPRLMPPVHHQLNTAAAVRASNNCQLAKACHEHSPCHTSLPREMCALSLGFDYWYFWYSEFNLTGTEPNHLISARYLKHSPLRSVSKYLKLLAMFMSQWCSFSNCEMHQKGWPEERKTPLGVCWWQHGVCVLMLGSTGTWPAVRTQPASGPLLVASHSHPPVHPCLLALCPLCPLPLHPPINPKTDHEHARARAHTHTHARAHTRAHTPPPPTHLGVVDGARPVAVMEPHERLHQSHS